MGIVAIAWAVWLGLKYLQWRMTYFVVTSRRVIYRSGVVSKRGVEIPLERVNNINFHQRLIDRIIGAGDLDIESAGKDGQSHFDFIRHPDGVQHEIYRQMEFRNMPVARCSRRPQWCHRRSPGPPCPSRSSSSPASATRVTSPRPSTSKEGGVARPDVGAALRRSSARRRRRGRRSPSGRCRSRRGSGRSTSPARRRRGCAARVRRRTRRSRHR